MRVSGCGVCGEGAGVDMRCVERESVRRDRPQSLLVELMQTHGTEDGVIGDLHRVAGVNGKYWWPEGLGKSW